MFISMNKILKIIFSFTLCILIFGCQSIKINSNRDQSNKSTSATTPTSSTTSSSNSGSNTSQNSKALQIDTVHKANPIIQFNDKSEENVGGSDQSANSNSNGNGNQASSTNEFNKTPKIGIIIGPGHLRSFIAVGVLQELQKAKLPIHSIVGLEWGAIPASIYSIHGQASEVEWQMMKLRYSDLPEKSLLGQVIATQDISSLNGFFQDALSNVTFEQLKVPFTCLGLDLKNRQYFWMKKGQVSQVISNCVTHPPFFKSKNNFVGGVDVKLASDYLKSTGANYIILINSIPLPTSGAVFDNQYIDFGSQALWGFHQQQLTRFSTSNNGVVDFMIDTSSVSIKANEFDQRRELVRKGQDVGLISIQKLSQKIKF